MHENLVFSQVNGHITLDSLLPLLNYFKVSLWSCSCLPERLWWNSSGEVTRPPEDDLLCHFTSLNLLDRSEKCLKEGKGRNKNTHFCCRQAIELLQLIFFKLSPKELVLFSLPSQDVLHDLSSILSSSRFRNLAWCYLVNDKH